MEVDFGEVFDAFPQGAAVLGPDLRFRAVNSVYEHVSGRSREELIGRGIFDVFPPRAASHGEDVLRTSVERVLADGEPDVVTLQRYDIEVPGHPGVFEERYWSVVNAPVKSDSGEVVLIVHRVEEVTAFIEQLRKADASGEATTSVLGAQAAAVEAEVFARARQLQEVNRRLRRAQAAERRTAQALRQAVEQQREMVADTSHDLRGPITGLQTRLELALADPQADPREILHAALHDAQRLGDIVADLLELARLEAGTPSQTQPVDLAQLVENELGGRTHTVTVTTRLEAGVLVDGSYLRLARLLNNLVANAERHTTSCIDITVAANGGEAVLEVTDDGPGIPLADREAVFRRFYRRADAIRTDPEGTGLGLPVARQIALAHHGTLTVVDHPDGCRMSLRLPRLSDSGLSDSGLS